MTITREKWLQQQEAKSLVGIDKLVDCSQQRDCDQKLLAAMINLYRSAALNQGDVHSASNYGTQPHEVWPTKYPVWNGKPADDAYNPFLCN